MVLVDAPMDARSFAPLADLLAVDHTVLGHRLRLQWRCRQRTGPRTGPTGAGPHSHRPRAPLDELLDDREQVRAQTKDVIATYLTGDVTGAWAKFFVLANITLPEGAIEAMFGGQRDPQAVADEHFWFAHEMRPTTRWQPDIAALRDSPTRIAVGIGEESGGQACDRTSTALAATLGIEPTRFPGGHIAFADDPDGFNTPLRAVLHQN